MADESIGQQITNAVGGWFTKPTKFPTANDILSSIILTSTDTHNKGIGGYRFTQMRDDEVEIGSNITDYVVESGMTIQDAIQLKPLRLKLSGLAAEVSYGESKTLSPIDNIINGFKPLISLTPSLSNATQGIYDKLNSALGEYDKFINQVNSIIGIWSDNTDSDLITSDYKQSLQDWYKNLAGTVQQKAFGQLYSKWKARDLMKIETPWGVLENMVIESVVFKQLSRSNTYSEIEVTLKQLTFARSQVFGENGRNVDAGRRNGQIDDGDTGQTGSGSTEETGPLDQEAPIYYFDGGEDPVSIEYRNRAG